MRAEPADHLARHARAAKLYPFPRARPSPYPVFNPFRKRLVEASALHQAPRARAALGERERPQSLHLSFAVSPFGVSEVPPATGPEIDPSSFAE
jgi:hypothetical protein